MGKKATANPSFHHPFSTQLAQKQGVPGLISSAEIFIFPLYYIWVNLTISYVNIDEKKEIFAHLSTPRGSWVIKILENEK